MSSRSKSLVIFDLDGVILDSRDNMSAAWHAVQQETGTTVPFDAYFQHIGRPFRDILVRIGIHDNHDAIERIYRINSSRFSNLYRFYPHVEETLVALAERGLCLAVVTSKDQLRTDAVLAQLPVTFKSVQSPKPGFRGKPAPDQLLLASAECNTDPGHALYVGDMDADYEAARRAGIEYVHALWGYGDEPADRCTIASSFSDLLKLV